jgi:chromosome partitioning protein
MVISIVNQKGGTGKTTTAINLSSGLVESGKKVLLLGMDIQGDLSYALNIIEFKKSISDVLMDDVLIKDIVVSKEGVDVVPSDMNLADVEFTISNVEGNYFLLKEKLQEIKGQYDYVIIDCSPSLSVLTVNALCASDQIIIPLQLTVMGINGLELMLKTVEDVKKALNPALKVMGVLPVMVDSRKNLTNEIFEYLREKFDLKIFKTVIRSNVKAAEAPSFGQSVLAYAPKSISAIDYKKLVKEIIQI